jgi:hypothetical protein
MDTMRSKATNMLRVLLGLALGLMLTILSVRAQQPSPTPSPKKSADDTKTQSSTATDGEDAGDYTINSSLEIGYRGQSVDGNLNKYKSDLNYKAGPRIFDSSFLMRAKKGRGGGLFDELLVTSTGWGADPYGQMRISAENPRWYRFDGSYRRFKYFNNLNNLANPAFNFYVPGATSTSPNLGQHAYDTRQQLGDFDLTILPKNERIRFTIGYSPERYSGPAFATYHIGGDDFMLLQQVRSRANNFRIGADVKLGPIDISFLQGFRRFREDTFINDVGRNLGNNPVLTNAFLTSFQRNNPVRGSINFTRLSLHTFVAKKLDITARLIYTHARTNYNFAESFTGNNISTRATGALNPPNILNLGAFNIAGDATRPNTLGDLGATYQATDKLRISETFRVETFQINGGALYNASFFLARANGTAVAPVFLNNFGEAKITKYRKIQNTVEGDYQFNNSYSMHFGYRYGTRHIETFLNGFNLAPTQPLLIPGGGSFEEETNHTNAFFGGFKARPVKTWTLYFDAEHGTADNVFTRVGNYNYTNFRARSRYAPNRKWSLNLSVITRNNSNPSEIDGLSLTDFGVDTKSRIFASSVTWSPTSKLSFDTGYNFNYVNSDAAIIFYVSNVRQNGTSLYYMRNHFFFFDASAQLNPRVTLYAAYRINKDTGQGDRLASLPNALLITSYPMSYQSPEARLAIRLNRWLDWNVGYQYYNYNESRLISPNPQNYHAHLPYTSLRFYFGRGRG